MLAFKAFARRQLLPLKSTRRRNPIQLTKCGDLFVFPPCIQTFATMSEEIQSIPEKSMRSSQKKKEKDDKKFTLKTAKVRF
jgi:hypothetical protein